ncbi:MAG: hypothetical protein GX591_16985 [Planctomycetes bacterium]|nr:hypothetical protein [Planctomycetota bacterium]
MFLRRWAGRALAIPVRIAALVQGLLRMPNHRLLRMVWTLSGDEAPAVQSLGPLLKEKRAAEALALVRQWVASRPGPGLVGFMGLLLADAGDLAGARQALQDGRLLAAPDPMAILDTLEFAIAQRDDDFLAARQCALRFEQRRDLPPLPRRLVLHERMVNALMDRDFDDAGRRAAFLLEIQPDPTAEMVLWALAARRGDAQAAAAHLARGTLEGANGQYYQVLGAWAAQLPDAARYEQELQAADESLYQRARKAIAAREAAR